MLRVGSVVLNVSDMSRAAEFWSRALGYGVRGGVVREDESAVLVIAGEGPSVTLDEDDRMHLDLYVDSEEESGRAGGTLGRPRCPAGRLGLP